MKRTLLSTLLLAILSFSVGKISAQTFQDFFKPETNVTWLGVDFTGVKVINESDVNIERLVSTEFSGINDLVLNEPKKYDLGEAFHKDNVATDLSLVKARNKTISESKITSTDEADKTKFTNATIDKMVKEYNFGNKKGIGVIFFMEYMSKIKDKEKAGLWVAFVDMASKKVLYTERMEEPVGGFSLKNYYAKPVYEALNDIGKKYKTWKKDNNG